jgi:hypothetical protein
MVGCSGRRDAELVVSQIGDLPESTAKEWGKPGNTQRMTAFTKRRRGREWRMYQQRLEEQRVIRSSKDPRARNLWKAQCQARPDIGGHCVERRAQCLQEDLIKHDQEAIKVESLTAEGMMTIQIEVCRYTQVLSR